MDLSKAFDYILRGLHTCVRTCQKNVNFDRHFLSIHGKFLFRSFKFLEMPLK